jgi:hypothetical protein
VYLREDQFDARITLDGVPYGDSWKSKQGGNLSADSSKTRPGGMGKEVALGGPAQRDNATLQIQMSDIVSLWHKTFEAKVGNGRVKIGITYLDAQRNPTGESETLMGILDAARLPDNDSESSDPAMYEIEVALDEQGA